MTPSLFGFAGECERRYTAYGGERNATEKHLRLPDNHGWAKCFDVDLPDAEGSDTSLEIPNSGAVKHNLLGKNQLHDRAQPLPSAFNGRLRGTPKRPSAGTHRQPPRRLL